MAALAERTSSLRCAAAEPRGSRSAQPAETRTRRKVAAARQPREGRAAIRRTLLARNPPGSSDRSAAMRTLARFVTGRRTKFLVLVAWIVFVAAMQPLASKLSDATDDRTEASLPKYAESTKVIRTLERDFPGGQTANGLIVYRRPGGLTAADRAKIVSDARAAARALPLIGRPVLPFEAATRRAQLSRDGSLAYTVVALPNNNDKLPDWGKRMRKITGHGSGGLKVYVTGDVGFNADFDEVFASFDTKLLLATVVLVLVLLLAIYRSPLIALAPLLVVGFAYAIAQG